MDDVLLRRDVFAYGNLWNWGSNVYGQLGDGTTNNRTAPNPLETAPTGLSLPAFAFLVSSGIGSTAAILTDGSLWTWGYNRYGALGDGTTSDRSSPVTVAGGGTWKQVSMSKHPTVTYNNCSAIKSDGTLWAWGNNNAGQIGNGTTSNYSSPVSVVGGFTWIQVVNLGPSIMAIRNNNTVWGWGDNFYGSIGNGTTSNYSSPVSTSIGTGNTYIQISGSQDVVAGIQDNGTLWTWGYNNSGALGDGTTSNRSSPVTVVGGFKWKQVSIGGTNAASLAPVSTAIKSDGTLWAWGTNDYGQIGNGTTSYYSSPVSVAGGGTNWKQVSAGLDSVYAIKSDGTFWAWGRNNLGQLSDATSSNRSSPVSLFWSIYSTYSYKQISAAQGCAFVQDGTDTG